ncbi:lycopene cyclase domain-containing protein [Microbacterium sp.]|uniref:lycopene cyclase domain-containing protein n=1 Tax=Microbacterium sp. TaxID=51671 RepID=UPI002600CB32|nr:lycopene cyclase domain-containing protein [Microbacterium sp.]
MTYALLIVPFAAVTILVTLATARRADFGHRMGSSAIAALALCVLTAIFDNIMIALGLFTYPPEHLSGIRVGLAPLEDFSYPVCAAFFVPAVFTLLSRRRA